MAECSDKSLRYLAAVIADFLMEGLTLDELKRLFAVIQLINNNITAELTMRALPKVEIEVGNVNTNNFIKK